jgi:hypothetical protein
VVEAGACVGGAFGDVLGDVGRHGIVGQRVRAAGGQQRSGVELGAPAQFVFAEGRGVRDGQAYGGRGGVYGVGEEGGVGPGRGWLVGAGRSVEAYDGVYVDGGAFLVLGDLGVGDADRAAQGGPAEARTACEVVVQVVGERLPQASGVCVPQDVGGVVVAVGAERLPEEWVGVGVDEAAAGRLAVLAVSAAGVAAFAAGRVVDGAEAGGGQGGEEAGSVAYRVGDVLAAGQSGADQVVGVAGVESGAGFADGGAAVAAADGEALEGFGGGVVVVEDFPGGRVAGGGGAGQVDGVGAAARGGDLLEPSGVLGVVGETDDVPVGFAEPVQARRAVEDGAPALRGGGGGDGGGALSGWAAEAAGADGGWRTAMGDRSLSCGVRVGQRMEPVPRQMRQRRRCPVQVLRAPSPLQAGQRTRFMGMRVVFSLG